MSQNSLKRDFHGGSVDTGNNETLHLSVIAIAPRCSHRDAVLQGHPYDFRYKIGDQNFSPQLYMVIIEVFIMLNPWNL